MKVDENEPNLEAQAVARLYLNEASNCDAVVFQRDSQSFCILWTQTAPSITDVSICMIKTISTDLGSNLMHELVEYLESLGFQKKSILFASVA